MNKVPGCLGFLAGIVLLAGIGQAAASPFTFIDLGGLVTGSSVAYGINNAGQVVGYHATTNGPRATLWQNELVTELGLNGPTSVAYGINNAGQVVGSMDFLLYPDNDLFVSHATVWNGGIPTDLGGLPNGTSVAYGINDIGQITGAFTIWGQSINRAVLWNEGTANLLNSPPDKASSFPASYAKAINIFGQVAGFIDDMRVDRIGYAGIIWNSTGSTLLGTLGGTSSAAYDINNAGQIVGFANLPNAGYHLGEPMHATLWQGSTVIDLGTLGGSNSRANAINDAGAIVGYANLPFARFDIGEPMHAAMWNGTTLTDLNTLLDTTVQNAGWVLTEANDINDNGWIVGAAHNYLTGENHAFLLVPTSSDPISYPASIAFVPEPETPALLLAGLGALGLTSRRSRRNRKCGGSQFDHTAGTKKQREWRTEVVDLAHTP
jgi:probable HAF family extracellular repeat protein